MELILCYDGDFKLYIELASKLMCSDSYRMHLSRIHPSL